jgi:hypothetical protein
LPVSRAPAWAALPASIGIGGDEVRLEPNGRDVGATGPARPVVEEELFEVAAERGPAIRSRAGRGGTTGALRPVSKGTPAFHIGTLNRPA